MSMETDFYFLNFFILHDNNNDSLQNINSFEEGQTLELSAHCISGKLSAAILGKPSGENLAEPMKKACTWVSYDIILREN